ncbi:MAG: radical SAM protein [Deltaproteobacteria bacterium]|nr:radical SAM protein [Deltaproteobacteria bacterium]
MTHTQDPGKGHEVVGSVIYGPVRSRRYGNSLGINLSPMGKKVCTFNCVYCQLGWGDEKKTCGRDDFLSSDVLLGEISQGLFKHLSENDAEVDNIVVSGNGEPTLHPDFALLTHHLIHCAKKNKARMPVICFTNGSTLSDDRVFDALQMFDECCVKLDAATSKIDLPNAAFNLDAARARMAALDHLVIQSCFVEGVLSNTHADEVGAWVDSLEWLSPKRIDIYTISRNTPHNGLTAVAPDALSRIANHLSERGYKSVRVCI